MRAIHVKTDNIDQDLGEYYDKVREIPKNKSLEVSILGMLLMDHRSYDDVHWLSTEDFYYDQHKVIFAAVQYLKSKKQPVDALTVWERLKATNEIELAGGPAYISELTNHVASTANIEYYSGLLRQYTLRRSMIAVGLQTVRDAFDIGIDAVELVDSAEKSIFQITSSYHSKTITTGRSAAQQVLADLKRTSELAPNELTGTDTGFPSLNRLINGFQKSDLICIGARPGMGKTAAVLKMAQRMSLDLLLPGIIFNLEMSALQLSQRIVSIDSNIPVAALRDGRKATPAELFRIGEAVDRLSQAPLFIDDTPGVSIHEIRSKARQIHSQHGLAYIIVDYIQLMGIGNAPVNGRSRDEIVGEISKGLKGLAKELDVPIIALSQLNRGVETKADRRPGLAHLRESGSIEQDCDLIAFLYRPEYYGITKDSRGRDLPAGLTEFIVAKNRHGELETLHWIFEHQFTRFRDLEYHSADFDQLVNEDLPAGATPSDTDLPF